MISPFLDVRVNKNGFVSRRDFVKQLTVAGGAAGVMQLGWRDMMIAHAKELQKQGKAMILLWMDGGPSQFETFNPKIGSKNQGPAKAIDTAIPGVQFAEYWPKVASIADKISFVLSMSTGEADHFRAIKLMKSGYALNPTIAYPAWGSLTAHERYEASFDLPGFVRIGKPRIKTRDINAGVLGAKFERFWIKEPGTLPEEVIPTVPEEVLRRRLALADALDAEFARTGGKKDVKDKQDVYEQTTRFVTSPKLKAFSLDDEPGTLRDEYGRTNFGQGCLLARRLVETGVHFVEVFSHGDAYDAGWDTHGNGFRDTPNLCGEADPGFATLVTDLEQRGMLDDVFVVWMGEFGRTPKIKKDGGRDHYAKGWPVAFAGGGVQPGRVVGATDKDGIDVSDKPFGVQDLFLTFCHVQGFDPEHEYWTNEAQPHKLVKDGGGKGKVIEELF